jgi:hypothetical protein
VLTLEGVREEGGERLGLLDGFASAGRWSLNRRELMLRALLDCWCCRSNSSSCRTNSKGVLATSAAKYPPSLSNEGHFRG